MDTVDNHERGEQLLCRGEGSRSENHFCSHRWMRWWWCSAGPGVNFLLISISINSSSVPCASCPSIIGYVFCTGVSIFSFEAAAEAPLVL